jgi:hypothetical protein
MICCDSLRLILAFKINPLKGYYTTWREDVLRFVTSVVSLGKCSILFFCFSSLFLGEGFKYFVQVIVDLVG